MRLHCQGGCPSRRQESAGAVILEEPGDLDAEVISHTVQGRGGDPVLPGLVFLYLLIAYTDQRRHLLQRLPALSPQLAQTPPDTFVDGGADGSGFVGKHG